MNNPLAGHHERNAAPRARLKIIEIGRGKTHAHDTGIAQRTQPWLQLGGEQAASSISQRTRVEFTQINNIHDWQVLAFNA